jgi:hypothetical protein
MLVPDSSNQGFGQDDQMAPVKSGEYIIPEPVVKRKGTQFFDNLVKNTLKEVMPPSQVSEGGTGTPETGYAKGGEVWGSPLSATGSEDFSEPSELDGPGPVTPSTIAWGGLPASNFNPNVNFNAPPDMNRLVYLQNNFQTPIGNSDKFSEPIQGEFGRNFNPWSNFFNQGYIGQLGTPGALQGPTSIPTTFDSQGYPFAVPVTNPTQPQQVLHPLGGAYLKSV